MSDRSIAATRFFALAASHFSADFFSAVLPGILPAALLYFHLDLGYGVILLSAIGIGANLLQIPASAIDRDKSSPRLLVFGILLASAVLILPFLPEKTRFWHLALLLFLAGSGIALVHPLGLRGVHALPFSVKVSVPLFMTCGFFGAAVAPWTASLLVTFCGMKGLLFLFVPVALIVLLLLGSRLKLQIPEENRIRQENAETTPWRFGALFFFALFLNCGTAVFTGLLPTMLHQFGYTLAFGGFCNTLFGVGSSVGSILLGIGARRFAPPKMILPGMVIGILLGMLYLESAELSVWAAFCIPLLGLLLSAPYPLLVALSVSAPGRFSSTLRSGLIVGGTWGIAGVMLLPAGQIAERVSLSAALATGLGCYVIAFGVAALTCRKAK
ncbi:MAG: MFS transporter [Victivallaceae bacterium]|nr:MFS transporter [Victivallaceae bacterium]